MTLRIAPRGYLFIFSSKTVLFSQTWQNTPFDKVDIKHVQMKVQVALFFQKFWDENSFSAQKPRNITTIPLAFSCIINLNSLCPKGLRSGG